MPDLLRFLTGVDSGWIASVGGVTAAVFGALSYRLLKRQNDSVSWEVVEEKASGHLALKITNKGGRKAVGVVVASSEALELAPMWTTEDVDPGGHMYFATGGHLLGDRRPRTVTIRWRGRLGRRKSWTTAVP